MKLSDQVRTRAMRLRSARALTGMSRREFGVAFQISESTLTAWENQKNPLSPKGAKRICEALYKVGVYCTVGWLMDGAGISPRSEDELQSSFLPLSTDEGHMDQQAQITAEALTLKEISTFRYLHKNAVVKLILDDAMHPFYGPGDYVGGVWCTGENVIKLLHKNCIIEIPSGEAVIRKLLARKENNTFTLAAINPSTCVENPILFDQKINRAAEILWHRRQPTTVTV